MGEYLYSGTRMCLHHRPVFTMWVGCNAAHPFFMLDISGPALFKPLAFTGILDVRRQVRRRNAPYSIAAAG